jgi:hypothetical protein
MDPGPSDFAIDINNIGINNIDYPTSASTISTIQTCGMEQSRRGWMEAVTEKIPPMG